MALNPNNPKGAGDLSLRDKNGHVPLHWAARAGKADVTELLCQAHSEKRIPLDLQGEHDKATPLNLAAAAAHAATIDVLCAHHASTQIVDKDGATPLHRAILGPRNPTPSQSQRSESAVAKVIKIVLDA